MIKTILKEGFIFVLFAIIILLILGIIIYDNMPANKVVPGKVEYTLPEKLQEELNVLVQEDEKEVLITYKVDNSDLDKYEKTNKYNPGKADPFGDYGTNAGNTVEGNTAGNNTGGGNTNGNTNSNTSGNLYENNTTK